MDAVEFLKEYKRLCDNYTGQCKNCPLQETNNCSIVEETSNSKEIVFIVEKWSKEHPRKTRLLDFKEKYPKAEYKMDGICTPNICCKKLGYTDCCPTGKNCVECWNEPVE